MQAQFRFLVQSWVTSLCARGSGRSQPGHRRGQHTIAAGCWQQVTEAVQSKTREYQRETRLYPERLTGRLRGGLVQRWRRFWPAGGGGLSGVHQLWLREVLEGGEEGGGPINLYQKWPNQICPIVNFIFSHDGHFGLGPQKSGRTRHSAPAVPAFTRPSLPIQFPCVYRRSDSSIPVCCSLTSRGRAQGCWVRGFITRWRRVGGSPGRGAHALFRVGWCRSVGVQGLLPAPFGHTPFARPFPGHGGVRGCTVRGQPSCELPPPMALSWVLRIENPRMFCVSTCYSHCPTRRGDGDITGWSHKKR